MYVLGLLLSSCKSLVHTSGDWNQNLEHLIWASLIIKKLGLGSKFFGSEMSCPSLVEINWCQEGCQGTSATPISIKKHSWVLLERVVV